MDIISTIIHAVLPRFYIGVFGINSDIRWSTILMNMIFSIAIAVISIQSYRFFSENRTPGNPDSGSNSERDLRSALSFISRSATSRYQKRKSVDSGKKRPAAVMFTDVVDFSRHMEENEEMTLQSFQRDLKNIVDLTARYDGIIVKTVGDGVLVYFSSSVSAVRCALDLQRNFKERKHSFPAESRLEHRVGIHHGEIVAYGYDIMGRTVNIAARLQQIAPPGGICVSETLYDSVRHDIALSVVDREFSQLRNLGKGIITCLICDHIEDYSHSVIMFPRLYETEFGGKL